MAGPAPTVTIASPAAWQGRTIELAGQLRSAAPDTAVIPDPRGRPLDPDDVMTVTDPAYWADRPVELEEALTLASIPGFAVEAATPERVAGAAPSAEGRLTMTVEEAAAALGISRALAYDAASRNEIPVIRIGRRLLVPRAALSRLLDEAERSTDRDR